MKLITMKENIPILRQYILQDLGVKGHDIYRTYPQMVQLLKVTQIKIGQRTLYALYPD